MQGTGIGRGTGRADQIGDFMPFAHLIISLHLVSDLDVLFCAETSASHEIGIWWCMSESGERHPLPLRGVNHTTKISLTPHLL